MNRLVDQSNFSPATCAADAAAAEPAHAPNPPLPTGCTTDEQFAIALNIARMEALDTLYAAATIRDSHGNPTREAIFAANRILAFTIHRGRRAAAGAAPVAPFTSRATPTSSATPLPTSQSFNPQFPTPRIDINLDIRPPSPRGIELPRGGDDAAQMHNAPPQSASSTTSTSATASKLPQGEAVEAASAAETEGAPASSSFSTSPPALTSDIQPPTSDIAVGATACSPPPSSPTPSPTQSLVTDTFSGSAIPTSELRIPHSPDLTTIAEQAINCLRQELNLSDEQVAALRADPVAWLNEHLPEYMTDDPPGEITALEAALLAGTADDG